MAALPPRQFHPRIGGGHHDALFHVPENAGPRAQAETQLRLLVRDFLEIIQFVQPAQGQLGTFSHKIRNLLLVACTEFEAQCKGVLLANDAIKDPRMTTRDYVKIKDRLHLDEYAFRWTRHADFGEIRPFDGWDRNSSTASLPWYDVYNKTKHDRENHFDKATLRAASEAILACFALVHAQYVGCLAATGDWIHPDDIRWMSYPSLRPDEPYHDPDGDPNGWIATP